MSHVLPYDRNNKFFSKKLKSSENDVLKYLFQILNRGHRVSIPIDVWIYFNLGYGAEVLK